MLACSYSSVCSGCDWLLKSNEEIRELKITHLRLYAQIDVGTPIDWVSLPKFGLRDRVDLMIDYRSGRKKIGLFDRFQSGIVDLQGCPQMTPNLESWYNEFRKLDLPVDRGSIRLRVAPNGDRGVWLDFANLDVKRLLEEKYALISLLNLATVEIGQRRKRLILRPRETIHNIAASNDDILSDLKLVDPILEPWFETYFQPPPKNWSENWSETWPQAPQASEGALDTEVAVPLFCTIGSFTQPGFAANYALVSEARRRFVATGAKRIIEFGSGIGNFTIPLASVCQRVDAYEVNELALIGLQRTIAQTKIPVDRIQIHTGNFQIERKQPIDFHGADLVFVDPPRSGLMKFLDALFAIEKQHRPHTFIYVSCFTESFSKDKKRLEMLGYALESVSIIDQFPQSHHYEVIATFHRS